jgi:uncharacterized lipoprotein NlpE involved in copper resistance
MTTYTSEEVLAKINAARVRLEQNPRELVLANSTESANFSQNPREVYKEEKNKRSKHVSRDQCEEIAGSKVSGETCPMTNVNGTETTSSFELTSSQETEGVMDLEKRGNVIAPAITSSRTYTGISVQHAKTKKGIKVSIALQTASDAAQGEYIELTGELKRHDRLRELKAYADDCDSFAILYKNTIDELKELKPIQGKYFCMGRVHDRGARAAWYTDIMVVGKLNDDTVLELIIININGEEYEIPMTHELSERQQQSYHSGGIYGELKRNRRAPSLATAPRKTF